ncbi:MAG: RNA polymerase sigma factor [Spongiibacter sp.]|uniref:Sigma-70 family RNA polymerase sigma factor n=1 Tax=Spongiibacter thalassae TaxID=2721624 RepID=A0ABX1GEM7_9GAMM|nr:sigma-70 family RNA polymerase sigma factor [Spongiibacter thalassae]
MRLGISDAELLERVASGDGRAFGQLAERHSARVLSTAYSVVQSRADAEDICQEVFVRLWKQAPNWQDEAQLSTWLYRVAMNLALNHRQRVQQRMVTGSDEVMRRIGDAPAAPPPIESDPQLLQALGKLPENQRVAMSFRYFQDLSIKQIAQIMDSTPKAVESALGRAKLAMKKMLGEQYAADNDVERENDLSPF